MTHLPNVRYLTGLNASAGAVILRQDHGTTVIARTPFKTEPARDYRIALTAKGSRLSLSVDGREVLAAEDDTLRYGMGGIRMGSPGRMSVGRIEIVEL